MLDLLLYWGAMIAAHRLMDWTGCFDRPVLYPDLDHPFRYWWARRVRQ